MGSHGGISIGENGPSQMAVEDYVLLCALPGFVVLSPSDEFCTRALVHHMVEYVGPCYIRTGRPKVAVIYRPEDKFEIGKAKVHGDGKDVAIVVCALKWYRP